MSKKITIIGAGIAGLTAGCYARMNGFEAEIFESHSISGGLCTAWKRGEYTFDGCLDWLTGSGPGNDFYRFWKEVDAFDDDQIIYHDVLYRFEGKDKRQLIIYSDIDRLEKHMLELSPEDQKQTKQFCKWIRKFSKFSIPMDKPIEFYNFVDTMKIMIKIMPLLKDYIKLNKTTIGEFADTFKDNLIREFLKQVFATSEYCLFNFILGLGISFAKSGGYPIGGSLEFAKRIEKRFTDLGGVIHFKSKVEKIIVEDNKAIGLKLKDGSEHRSDYVISAADMNSTLYSMLEGKYLDPGHVNLFKEESLAPSCVQVSLGVDMDLANEPACTVSFYPASEIYTIGNTQFNEIAMKNFAFDPTMAPKGKTVIVVRYHMNEYDYWKKLYADKSAYKQKKEEILQFTISQLERKFSGITEKIEASDVCTPITFQRYTNNWNGTYMTWINTPKNTKQLRNIKKNVPGLENFWMSGMWVMAPGGIPTGLKTSRDIMQIICKQEKQKFSTNTR